MRIIVVGAGGVGTAAILIAARRDFFETCVVADYDERRAVAAVERAADARFSAAAVDASHADRVAALVREHSATHVLNAVDPRFVMPIFEGALASGADHLDMTMSLSRPHPESPYEQRPGPSWATSSSRKRSAGRRRAGFRSASRRSSSFPRSSARWNA